MLEVLVAIFILTLGLLGTAAMQSQMQATQVEAYQRARRSCCCRTWSTA